MNWRRWLFRKNEPNSSLKLNAPLGATTTEDRCIGCLLGTACGDILGANLEKLSRKEIRRWHGRGANFLDSAGRPFGCYTHDTEMTLALASSLVVMERLDGGHCAQSYARFFARPPLRSYGQATKEILQAIIDAADYRYTGKLLLPQGSCANGGVMRIGPVGLAFRHAADSVLKQAVQTALLPTHVHPEAIDGAWLQAKIVGWLAKIEPKHFDAKIFLEWLQKIAATDILREKLAKLERGLREGWDSDRFLSEACATDENGRIFQIHAAEALVCALWSFVRHYRDPEECLIQAVGLGGDSDTIGAIAGAQAGALHGTDWIPSRWFDNIENKPETGRDVIIAVARQLAKLDLRRVDVTGWPPNRSAYIKKREIQAGGKLLEEDPTPPKGKRGP